MILPALSLVVQGLCVVALVWTIRARRRAGLEGHRFELALVGLIAAALFLAAWDVILLV